MNLCSSRPVRLSPVLLSSALLALTACTADDTHLSAAAERDVFDKETVPSEIDDDGSSHADVGACGDGLLGWNERCDWGSGGAMSETCESIGYTGGTLACAGDCQSLDVSACEGGFCGNGYVDEGEACDDGNTVVEFCFNPGDACTTCGAECQVVEGRQPVCGDGEIAFGSEDCDGDELAGANCVGFGYDGGEIVCGASCRLDFSLCEGAVCGNGVLDDGEECEPDFEGNICPYGEEECTICGWRTCLYETAPGRFCGNGTTDYPEEVCDTAEVLTCGMFGGSPADAQLTCNACRTLDDSVCVGGLDVMDDIAVDVDSDVVDETWPEETTDEPSGDTSTDATSDTTVTVRKSSDEKGCSAAAGNAPAPWLMAGLLALVAARRRRAARA